MSNDGPSNGPAVSVIIATYNRSHALRHAITSVRRSSFTDWELIVVGDACTDDTAACVASFDDSRIRFFNLPERCGDQSGPSNFGVGLAQGRYVAFLNHDDLYLPEHLEACVAALDAGGADLVWTASAVAIGKGESTAEGLPCRFELRGVPDASGYSPFSFYFASTWVFRRALAERVGPWRAATRLYIWPSQDWLFRAWRSGAAIEFLPQVSVIAVPAWHRPGSYASPGSPEHDWLEQWMQTNLSYRETILTEAALHEATQRATIHRHPSVKRVILRPLYALLTALGIHPFAFAIAMRNPRRGSKIHAHRARTGAQAILRR